MTRVKALRESIRKELERVCVIKFYKEFARPTAKPPFGECSLLLMRRRENWDEYDLLVNIADYGTDEARVEELAEAALEHLDCLDYFGEDGTSWSCYINSCQPIDNADKNIYQRRISAIIKYYRKD